MVSLTSVRVSLVDLYVLRGAGPSLECLTLRRAAGGRCPGAWETVHGHVEPGERPAEAALSIEHDQSEWLPVAEAVHRLAWPRERRALEDAVTLLGGGSAGPVEDVLRIC